MRRKRITRLITALMAVIICVLGIIPNVRNYIELKASSSTGKKTSTQKPKKEKVETQPVLSE